MDVEEEVNRVRQNLRVLEHKLLMEETSVQGTMMRMKKYKAMSMKVNEKIQNIKWKIFKADLILRYEKAKRRSYLEKIQRSALFRQRPKAPETSKRTLEEYIQLRKNLSDKLDALVKTSNEKEQQIFNLELEVKKLKEENETLIQKLWAELEKKEEEERRLEEELEEIKSEEEKINLAMN